MSEETMTEVTVTIRETTGGIVVEHEMTVPVAAATPAGVRAAVAVATIGATAGRRAVSRPASREEAPA